jgi:hypothetical protein
MSILGVFLGKLKNRSGSISVQVISKVHGKNKLLKTIGTGSTEQQIQKLWLLGKQEIDRRTVQTKIFISEHDTLIEQVMESLANANIRKVGSEIIFGKI